MPTLISFLGKGRREKQTNVYQRATYRFENGDCVSSSYFGLALTQKLAVDKLVILGTKGSIWDVFAEQLADDDEAALDRLIELNRAVAEECVDQDILCRLAPLLQAKISVPVEPVLIPYARDQSEQMAVLRGMAEHVGEGERVVLDVTHGFRHLPMLALVAARFLSRVRGVKVENIYYGALEMADRTTGETPVIKLDGLLHMLDWVDALTTYDKDGDYSIFAGLLEQDEMDAHQAKLLKEAAFFERTSNPVKAREKLNSVFPSVEQHCGPTGLLFRDELTKRISWFRSNRRSQWERSLAEDYLTRNDYVRAAIFMQEARISYEAESRDYDVKDYNARKKAQDHIGDSGFGRLSALRNALAHGVVNQNDEVSKALRDESRLSKMLKTLLKNLLP